MNTFCIRYTWKILSSEMSRVFDPERAKKKDYFFKETTRRDATRRNTHVHMYVFRYQRANSEMSGLSRRIDGEKQSVAGR